MSFADVAASRGGGGGGGASSSLGLEEDAFASTARGVASAIFQLTTNVTSFKRLVDALGTPKDTRELRGRLHRQRDALGQIAKDTTAAVKRLSELSSAPGAAPSAKATQTKLVKDFQAVLKEFQKAQRACAEREGAYMPQQDAGRPLLPRGASATPPPGGGGGGGGGQGSAGGGSLPPYADNEGAGYQRSDSLEQQALLRESKRQELLQLDGEIDYNTALIEEREAGILEIQSQIGEVNEIFQDLAVLVNEQGGMIDDIEANIVRTSAKTKEARAELVKAETHQRAARGKLLWMLLIVVCVLLFIMALVLPWGHS
jgi:syntaxin 7